MHDLYREDHQRVIVVFGDRPVVADAVGPVATQLLAHRFAETLGIAGGDFVHVVKDLTCHLWVEILEVLFVPLATTQLSRSSSRLKSSEL